MIQIELKSGRIPDGINRRMGFWKAEEYQKFTFPASELILDGAIPEENYQAWILIVRITELIFILVDQDGHPSRLKCYECSFGDIMY